MLIPMVIYYFEYGNVLVFQQRLSAEFAVFVVEREIVEGVEFSGHLYKNLTERPETYSYYPRR